jgi:hypothetical protein|tara:strand:+ start:1396 stop:2319 length:924 start_codon:yes stop_codon:yes gene_type:complete
MEYTVLLASVENLLGKGSKRARHNHAFHCPFCNHRKPKLEINFATNEKGENPWECWVCETKGRTIRSLLYQLKVPKEQAGDILKYLPKGQNYKLNLDSVVQLPKEFQLLSNATSTSYVGNIIKKYLYERGFTDNDFIKYGIGYATSGEYGGRIIIPSYSESNQLNFFVARSYNGDYFKYKNPEVSKDIIIFENFINWNTPIIICEGVFDAIAIKRNAVPILGKSISNSLMKKLVQSKSEEIYIALDKDAQNKALEYSEQFLNMGKKVFLVKMEDKDPSEMGFVKFTKHIQTAKQLDLQAIMQYKLGL